MHLAPAVSGHAMRAAMVMEDFLAELRTTYGLTPDQAAAVLDEATTWARARAASPYTRARDLAEERAA